MLLLFGTVFSKVLTLPSYPLSFVCCSTIKSFLLIPWRCLMAGARVLITNPPPSPRPVRRNCSWGSSNDSLITDNQVINLSEPTFT
ncbi:uncharacterized protein BT62DRAFT_621145 [Guyanagaster necrorhizus]|uniref:Uncharacterized protein n=1 Tax=Guyanagaster necrorhizus TaxID=856835 RepID=A0A9P7W144_9AGAR|nr:uncharacterized protein BT62DRAFT_621145 [Guyanagaster necrorhizus MCA 3950]KAG7450044.1 hypothetical protein BT62DRAFT_621145 [Guyanagaster necrorhizus MCA 3950]